MRLHREKELRECEIMSWGSKELMVVVGALNQPSYLGPIGSPQHGPCRPYLASMETKWV